MASLIHTVSIPGLMVGALVSIAGGRLPHADCVRLEPVSRRLLGLRFLGSGHRKMLWESAVQHMSAARVAIREHRCIAALSVLQSSFCLSLLLSSRVDRELE